MAQPNTRLKLPAPEPNESLCNPKVRGNGLLFVNRFVRRRSLSAVR
jgi:hypothetical protein